MHQLTEVVIEITRQCNLNCLHCGSDCGQAIAETELTIEQWKNALRQLADLKAKKVVFSGGEPTLRRGFGSLLVFTKELGMKVGFISNGFFVFDKPLRESIRLSQPFAVGLSIDGLKATHDRIRGNQKSWSNLIKNISLLKDWQTPVSAVTTLNRLNFRELPRLASFLDSAEIDSWQLQLAMPSGRMRTRTELLINEDDFGVICSELVKLRRLYPQMNIQAADCFGWAPPGTIRSGSWSGCMAGISVMAIDACGYVLPCLSLQSVERRENISDKSIASIWNDSSIFDFNRRFLATTAGGNCIGCDFLADCRGGCASQSMAYHGRCHSSPFCYLRTLGLNKKEKKDE